MPKSSCWLSGSHKKRKAKTPSDAKIINLLSIHPSFSSLKDVVGDGLKGFICRNKIARCQNVVGLSLEEGVLVCVLDVSVWLTYNSNFVICFSHILGDDHGS
jgi:hypothetical protein